MKKLLILALVLILPNITMADVKNPVMFIGQVIFNATAGAPLSADSNGQLVSGITNVEVTSTSFSCTTSDTALTSITSTPAAGTYLALFSSDFNAANGGVVVTLTFNIAGSAVTISQRKFMPFAGGTLTAGSQRTFAGLNSILTVNGSQAITVHCSTSSNTVTLANQQMQLVRLQ